MPRIYLRSGRPMWFGRHSRDTIESLERVLNRLHRGRRAFGPSAYDRMKPCRSCGRLFPADALYDGLCGNCPASTSQAGDRTHSKAESCRGCGIRFSVNLLQDGFCANCRNSGSHGRAESVSPEAGSAFSLSDAYRILQCDESAGNEEIRNRRRELVKACHSDMLPADAEDGDVQRADRCFREIQEAYEIVMQSRKKR